MSLALLQFLFGLRAILLYHCLIQRSHRSIRIANCVVVLITLSWSCQCVCVVFVFCSELSLLGVLNRQLYSLYKRTFIYSEHIHSTITFPLFLFIIVHFDFRCFNEKFMTLSRLVCLFFRLISPVILIRENKRNETVTLWEAHRLRWTIHVASLSVRRCRVRRYTLFLDRNSFVVEHTHTRYSLRVIVRLKECASVSTACHLLTRYDHRVSLRTSHRPCRSHEQCQVRRSICSSLSSNLSRWNNNVADRLDTIVSDVNRCCRSTKLDERV
jgi:hypothetical protein